VTTELANITLTWDGARLSARLACTRELGWLTTAPVPKVRRWSVPCSGVEELSPFELAAFLHQAVSEIERQWAQGQALLEEKWATGPLTGPLF
jgi:hypothetical protein